MASDRSSVWRVLTQRHSAQTRDAFIGQALRERPSWTVWLAWGLAGCVVALYLWLAVWGLWTFVQVLHPFHLWAFLGSVLVLMLVGLSWPRWSRWPPTLSAQAAPELSGLVREVAQALGLKSKVALALSPAFNASYGAYGWRQRPVLTLGLPILYGFSPQEWVAVIAHELAHGVNRDPLRGGVFGLASSFLLTLYSTLHPRQLWQARLGMTALPTLLGNALLWVASGLPYGLLWVMVQLAGQDSQRAEYRADLLAASVAGSDAAANALDQLHLGHLFEYSLHKQLVAPERPHLFQEFGHQLQTYSPAQWNALRERLSTEGLRLDHSHPPTAWRVAVVRAHPAPPRVILAPERAALIEAELRPAVARLQRDALETYREAITG